MKIFNLTPEIQVVCDWKKTSYGFKHEATLFKNGVEKGKSKATYYNRTWEKFEYETVLKSVVEKSSLSEDEKKACKGYIDNYKGW